LVIIILDKYLKEVYNIIIIKNPEKLISKDNKDYLLLLNLIKIQKRILNIKRKKFNKFFYKKQILYKLV